MKHRLIILLLFTGVLPLVLARSRKYFLIQEQKTWMDAQAFCRDKYTDLAIINTNDEMIDLQNTAQTQQLSLKAWLGLRTDLYSWRWSINNEPLGTFRHWDPNTNDPNNSFGNESCVLLFWSRWRDAPCNWMLTFICFDERVNGTEKYILIQQLKEWADAQSYCREYHTDLASARDIIENNVLAAICSYCWFGLSRDPWKWTDQTTSSSIISWSGGNMNDYAQNKSCGYLDGANADAEQCSIAMNFICFKFPAQKKIIKLKLKSSQDVNDPAIISAINKKFKQKLQEHGMAENISVIWRKQPDGKVFHKEEETTGTNTTDDCDSV